MKLLRVTVETPAGELVEVDLRTDLRDQMRYETVQPRLKLPPITQGGGIPSVAVAYFALKRAKSEIIADCSLEQWLYERCVDLDRIDEDGNVITDDDKADDSEGLPADPTQPARQLD